MVAFWKLKNVDQKTTDLINGFIKDFQKLLPTQDNSVYNIPSLVFVVTILYYVNPEHFTDHGEYMKLNEEKSIVQSKQSFKANTVYGNIKIKKQDTGIFSWIFKIISPPNEVGVLIGLDSSKLNVNTRFDKCLASNIHHYYGYRSFYDEFEEEEEDDHDGSRLINSIDRTKQSWWTGKPNCLRYGSVYTLKNTEVKMELNMDNKTIKYYVDGLDQGIAFDNICFDDGQEYSMCISMDEPMSVKLVDFQHSFSV